MSYTEIDNPGKGNCAFYGFSIGLIDIIKHEKARHGFSPTFNQLAEKVNGFDIGIKDIVNFNYQNQSRILLDKMQKYLRNILFDSRKQCLIDNNQNIDANNAYTNFCEIVWNHVNGLSTSSGFNELMKSQDLKKYAWKVAANIKSLGIWYPELKTKELNAAKDRLKELDKPGPLDQNEQLEKTTLENLTNYVGQREAFLNKKIEAAFRKDVFVPAQNDQLNENSLIIAAMKNVTVNCRWGTQTDLSDLARIFDINLHTLINGRAPYTPTDTINRPIITMNNKKNVHWTTRLSFIGSDFKGKEYKKHTKNSVITKQEIQDIMRSYTHGFIATLGTRNHRKKANDIVTQCNKPEVDVNDIIRILANYLGSCKNFSSNSSFKKRADYIIARAEHYNEAQLLSRPYNI